MDSKLKDIIFFVSNHMRVNADLALLQKNVEHLYQSFFEKLDNQFNNLTANDKYFLGLVRLNITNKDIATIKGISTESAKVFRYRLRKN